MLKNKVISNDEYLSYIIVIYYYLRIINNIGKRLLPVSLFYVVILISVIISAKYLYIGIKLIFKYKCIQFLCIEFIFVFLYLMSFILGTMEISTLTSYLFWTLGACIPLSTALYMIKDKKVFYNIFIKNSFIMLILFSFVILIRDDNIVYIMSFSYLVLVVLLFHINEFLTEKNNKYIPIIIYEILLIVLYGSRGPLLCLIVYIALMLFIKQKNYFLRASYILLIFLIIVYYDEIGKVIINTLDFYGYNNRTLTLLFGDITHLSGRDVIIKQAINMIINKPIIGWGIANEISYIGVYPHNIIVELILDFGIPLGSILVLIIGIMTIKTIINIRNHDNINADLGLIFMCCGLVNLLISGTYLKNIEFFLFIALLFPEKVKKVTR